MEALKGDEIVFCFQRQYHGIRGDYIWAVPNPFPLCLSAYLPCLCGEETRAELIELALIKVMSSSTCMSVREISGPKDLRLWPSNLCWWAAIPHLAVSVRISGLRA